MGARILVVDDSPTIRKVVTGILARHQFEPIDAKDGIEALQLLSTEKPDLMLVDFVMPRMNGYQLCMALRERGELGQVPIVLMSAKGDRIRGKFVAQTGALDAITKPFDARGLIAVIESALAKKEAAASRADDDNHDDEAISSRESWGDRTSRNQAVLQVSDRLAELLTQSLAQMSSNVPKPEKAAIAHAFSLALSPEVTSELAQSFSEANLSSDEQEILSGDLAAVSIAETLQLLEAQRKSGALILSKGKVRVTLYLKDGALDFANHSGLPQEFLLGRYLVDTQALTRADLDAHIEAARKVDQRLGDFLIKEEIIPEETLRSALVQQVSELLYEVVRWRKGRFRFTQRTDSADHGQGAHLGLRTAGLVMEGFRRVDEWRLIEDSFDFSDVLYRDELYIETLSENQELRPDEKRALSAIDGDATVGEILDKLEGSSFENCKVLYRLLNGRLVKRRTGGS